MIPLYKPNRYARDLDFIPSFSQDMVSELEDAMAAYLGCDYCIATSSGTSALLSVAMYLEEMGYNTFRLPDIHFSGTHSAFRRAGLRLDKSTHDVKVVQHLGSKTLGLHEIEINKGDFVVEDACHAFGSKYENGQMVGSCPKSDVTVFSFHPSKTITSGEGGLIATNDLDYYEHIKEIVNLGKAPGTKDIKTGRMGLNLRMSPVGAQMLLVQLEDINDILADRREALEYYCELLDSHGVEHQKPSRDTAAHLMIAYLPHRKVFNSLEHGFETSIHYPLYPYIEEPSAISMYHSEYAISLPMFDTITIGEIRKVVSGVI